MNMIAFRTDDLLEERLRRAVREEKKTKTQIIREALELYLDNRTASSQPQISPKRTSLAEVLKADIGTWDGPEDSSADAGKQLREILGEKHRTRRL